MNEYTHLIIHVCICGCGHVRTFQQRETVIEKQSRPCLGKSEEIIPISVFVAACTGGVEASLILRFPKKCVQKQPALNFTSSSRRGKKNHPASAVFWALRHAPRDQEQLADTNPTPQKHAMPAETFNFSSNPGESSCSYRMGAASPGLNSSNWCEFLIFKHVSISPAWNSRVTGNFQAVFWNWCHWRCDVEWR